MEELGGEGVCGVGEGVLVVGAIVEFLAEGGAVAGAVEAWWSVSGARRAEALRRRRHAIHLRPLNFQGFQLFDFLLRSAKPQRTEDMLLQRPAQNTQNKRLQTLPVGQHNVPALLPQRSTHSKHAHIAKRRPKVHVAEPDVEGLGCLPRVEGVQQISGEDPD